MPKSKLDNSLKPSKRAKKANTIQNGFRNSESGLSEEENDEMPESPNASELEKNDESDGHCGELSGQMSKMLEKFGNDINKTMQAKKKKLEQFTEESMRLTVKKVFEIGKNQYLERKKIVDQFQKEFSSILYQGEAELVKMKEAEAKFQKLLAQSQKQQQQMKQSHLQRIMALKTLSGEFCKGMGALEEGHVESYTSVHSELRREMAAMQKRMLLETQQQEMASVRNQLKHMF